LKNAEAIYLSWPVSYVNMISNMEETVQIAPSINGMDIVWSLIIANGV
jgi:hypothetical protein